MKKNNGVIPWSTHISIPILIVYFFLVLPGKNIFFHTNPWLFNYTGSIYFCVIIVFALYKLNLQVLGLSTNQLSRDLLVGCLAGGSLIFSLFLLNFLINLSGLSDYDLFSNRSNEKSIVSIDSALNYLSKLLVIPFLEQVFFTGIIFQSLLRKINPIVAIYLSGIIYSLAEFKMSLGAFGLGVAASLLFKITKTLYASIIFHASCITGAIIIKNILPKLNTLLGFMF